MNIECSLERIQVKNGWFYGNEQVIWNFSKFETEPFQEIQAVFVYKISQQPLFCSNSLLAYLAVYFCNF